VFICFEGKQFVSPFVFIKYLIYYSTERTLVNRSRLPTAIKDFYIYYILIFLTISPKGVVYLLLLSIHLVNKSNFGY